MKIRKQWMRRLLIIGVASILLTTIFLSFTINRYFLDYTTETYNNTVKEIKNISETYIDESSNEKKKFLIPILEGYLDDPIDGIKIFDNAGNEILDVHQKNRMMMQHMQQGNREKDVYVLKNNEKEIGILMVTRSSSVSNSLVNREFRRRIIINSLITGLVVLSLLVLTSVLLSKRMSEELIETAKLAEKADTQVIDFENFSKTEEVNRIQLKLINLSKKIKLKDQLRRRRVDSIIHETHTPLTVLQSNVEGMIDKVISPNEENLGLLLKQVNLLKKTFQQLDSNLITVNDHAELQNSHLESEIMQLVKGLKTKFKKKNIDLDYSFEGDAYRMIDSSKLIQIIYNLLNNAYKYTGANGQVQISIYNKENLVIEVKDTGIGMSDEKKSKIFEAYYRVNQGDNIEGQGLGLYLVKEYLDQMNGQITVQSEVNKGSTFKVIIPR